MAFAVKSTTYLLLQTPESKYKKKKRQQHTFRKAARPLPRCIRMPFQSGFKTLSNDSMPYGVAASARAARANAVIVRTFCCSSTNPASSTHNTHTLHFNGHFSRQTWVSRHTHIYNATKQWTLLKHNNSYFQFQTCGITQKLWKEHVYEAGPLCFMACNFRNIHKICTKFGINKSHFILNIIS